jgi:VWFA-related protein
MRSHTSTSVFALITLLVPLLLLAGPAVAKDKKLIELLPQKYQVWLEEVDLLILKEERKEFLELEKDYQRDAFIERFWQSRDPYVETDRNELKEAWYARLEWVRGEYRSLSEDRARMIMLNGEPGALEKLNLCPMLMQPLEVWVYESTGRATDSQKNVWLIYYQRGGLGIYDLWRPSEGLSALFSEPPEILAGRCPEQFRTLGNSSTFSPRDIGLECAIWILKRDCDRSDRTRWVETALRKVFIDEKLGGFEFMVGRLESRPPPRDAEWLDSFAAYSTDIPEDAATFAADLTVDYPGSRGSRTVVQGLISIPAADLEITDLDGRRSYNLFLTGEVLRNDLLFESFRYRFDIPAERIDDTIPLSFERLLRPGEFGLVLKLEDLNSGKLSRQTMDLSVPIVDMVARTSTPADPETARLEAAAEEAIRATGNTLRLIAPPGERQIGPVRFETAITGSDLAKVTFYLDGKLMLTKKRPPYSIELDLGRVPRPHTLRVTGYNAAGDSISGDEIQLNVGKHHFDVKLVQPQKNRRYDNSVDAEAEVSLPEGQKLDRLEFYLGETLLATHYQPPFRQPITLPSSGLLTYVRVLAYLEDGNTNEDMVFINAPDLLEEVDIQFVQLYTSVLDRSSRPVAGVGQDEFRIFEDGIEQEIARFEIVEELPIHAGILFDTSASMVDRLEQARDAALQFFRQIITPKDRASFITFNQRPTLASQFTADVDTLAAELAGLKAEGGTALYDSIVFSLYYFTGIRGQRALLILSDGQDQSSRYSFEEALQYAQTVGVKIYTIGLELPKSDTGSRSQLSKLANQTGGRAFFVNSVFELPAIYSAIEEELRSQYLLAYQSTNTSGAGEFRSVEVKLVDRNAEARTLRGYFP